MSTDKWRLEFREWCVREREQHIKYVEMLEIGTFRLSENHVDTSADWARRNRKIAREMDDLIAKIDEDIRSGS